MRSGKVSIDDARAESFRTFDDTRFFGVGKDHAKLIASIASNDIGPIDGCRAQR